MKCDARSAAAHKMGIITSVTITLILVVRSTCLAQPRICRGFCRNGNGPWIAIMGQLTKRFMPSLKHTNVGQTKFIIPNSK